MLGFHSLNHALNSTAKAHNVKREAVETTEPDPIVCNVVLTPFCHTGFNVPRDSIELSSTQFLCFLLIQYCNLSTINSINLFAVLANEQNVQH